MRESLNSEHQTGLETENQTGSLFAKERIDALQEGLAPYLNCFEAQVREAFMPKLSITEGVMIAGIFERGGTNLQEIKPNQPGGRTERRVMVAIREDLKAVFGEGIEEKVKSFVKEEIQPLRGDASEEAAGAPNKYLVMAVENVLRDLVAVARAFQLGDEELQGAALANLSLSLFARLSKGKFREKGFCDKAIHKEHIWMIRGMRDLPPGSGSEIGTFVESMIEVEIEQRG